MPHTPIMHAGLHARRMLQATKEMVDAQSALGGRSLPASACTRADEATNVESSEL